MTTNRIEIDPNVMLGKPVVKGTRIPVEIVLRKLGEDATVDDLFDAYPKLEVEDIYACLAHAADTVTLSMSGGSCIFSGLAALEQKRPGRAGAMQ